MSWAALPPTARPGTGHGGLGTGYSPSEEKLVLTAADPDSGVHPGPTCPANTSKPRAAEAQPCIPRATARPCLS